MSLCEAGCCAACVGAGAASSSVGQSVSDSIMGFSGCSAVQGAALCNVGPATWGTASRGAGGVQAVGQMYRASRVYASSM